MRKKWYVGILLGTLSLLSTNLMAKSQVTLLGEVAYVGNGGIEWTDSSLDVPEVKITIEDAYKNAGKTEKIILELNEAYWTDESGTNLFFYDLEHLSLRDITIRPINKYSIQLNIDIPSNITRTDQVSFKLPLWIKSISNNEEEIHITIKPFDEHQLIEEETLLLATKDTKRVIYKVGAIPELKKAGTIADITFTEISPYTLHNQVLTIQLSLNNSQYAFGELEYLSKSEHDADIDYILKPNKYVVYSGGLSNLSEAVKLKRYKKTDKEIIFTIQGGYASELGHITLTNIPIISKGATNQEEITVTLTSESVAGLPQKVVVANIVEQTAEEKAEQELKEMLKEDEKKIEEEIKAEAEVSKVTFKVGTNYYKKGEQIYQMDGITYIQSPGYTMVPLRYVAVALGLEEKEIYYLSGKIEFKYGDRQIKLNVGSNQAIVNGNTIVMETEVVLQGGRSYVPVGEVAKLLGIQRIWDNENKIVVFYK